MTELPINQVLCGDAAELMRGLPGASVHAIVTDPPYGLEFMGEEWDALWGSNELGVKPSHSMSPTYKHPTSQNFRCKKCGHWMLSGTPCRCEEPKWERPPREWKIPRKIQEWHYKWAIEAYRVLLPGASMLVMGGTRTYHRMACGVEDAGFEIKDTILWCYNSGFPKAQDLGKMIDRRLGAEREIVGKNPHHRTSENLYEIGYRGGRGDGNLTTPATPLAREWDGWKVGGLKPSYEPVVWAVKPPDGSTTDNVLKHKVGAINVDACRIPFEGDDDAKTAHTNALGPVERYKTHKMIYGGGRKSAGFEDTFSPQGRYPANMVRTDRFEDGYDRFYFVPKADRGERDAGLDGINPEGPRPLGISQWEKQTSGSGKTMGPSSPARNVHPTVKPIALMEHLIKLVTRQDQIVLDPFVGSGTTCIAARKLLRRYVGIDNNAEYCEIAKKRLAAIPPPLEVFA